MFALIGFILFLLFTLWATGVFVLSLMIGGSDLSTPKGKEWFFPLFLGCIATTCWVVLVTNSPF